MALAAAGPDGRRPGHRRDGGRRGCPTVRTRWGASTSRSSTARPASSTADGSAGLDRRVDADHRAGVRPGGGADGRPARPRRGSPRPTPPGTSGWTPAPSSRAARPTCAWSTTAACLQRVMRRGRWLEARVSAAVPPDVRAALADRDLPTRVDAPGLQPGRRGGRASRPPPRCSTAPDGPGRGARRRPDRLVARRRRPAADRRPARSGRALPVDDDGVLPLLALLVTAPAVAAFHASRGVPADVSAATLADLGQQTRVHRLVHGGFGLGTLRLGGRLRLVRRALPARPAAVRPRAAGHGRRDAGRSGCSPPTSRARERLAPEEVDASLAAALPFFAEHFPELPGRRACTAAAGCSTRGCPTCCPAPTWPAFQQRWRTYGEPGLGDEDALFFAFARPRAGRPAAGAGRDVAAAGHRVGLAVRQPLARRRRAAGCGDRGSDRTAADLGVLPTLLPGFSGTALPGLGPAAPAARASAASASSPGTSPSHDQLAALNAEILAANPRAVIALDEEGGDVTRLFADVGSPYPGNAVLGRLDDLAADRGGRGGGGVGAAAYGLHAHLRAGRRRQQRPGQPGDRGPQLRRRRRPRGPPRRRVGRAGCRAPGSARRPSTSPGTATPPPTRTWPCRSSTARSTSCGRASWSRSPPRWRPGAVAVMTSHLLLPQVDPDAPATFSRRIVTGLLREELGFAGVLVTDALDMAGAISPGGTPESAVRALAAGCDLLCLGNDNTDDAGRGDRAGRRRRGRRRVAARGAGRGGRRAGVHAMADGLTAARAAHAGPRGRRRRRPRRRRPRWARSTTRATALDWRRPGGRRLHGRPARGPAEHRRRRRARGVPTSATTARWSSTPATRSTSTPSGPVRCSSSAATSTGTRRPAATVDRLRATHDVLVVDLGWPSRDRAYADVATFGASRRVGRALLRLARALG